MKGRGERDAREDEPFMEPTEEHVTEAVENGEPYFPPTDPVVREGNAQAEIVGGFADTSMSDRVALRPSGSGGAPDGELVDAVRRELRRDASTSELDLAIDVREGIVTLRGRVMDLADSDSALAVAGRVPGIVDVVDEIEVEAEAGR